MSLELAETPAWEVGISGAALAGPLYRLRAEQATGVLLVRDAAQMAFLAVVNGMPIRIDFATYDPAVSEAQRWRDWYSRTKGDAIDSHALAQRWRGLFALEDALARFFPIALPPLLANVPQDWMGLIRAGLGVDGFNESALRRRLEPWLRVHRRFTLLEPVPQVLAELDALESAFAAHLREGMAFIDVLAAAHRFGEAQTTAVLRALYTLSCLGLVRVAPAMDGPVASSARPRLGMAQLDIVLAQHQPRAEGAVLGSIFAQPERVRASTLGVAASAASPITPAVIAAPTVTVDSAAPAALAAPAPRIGRAHV